MAKDRSELAVLTRDFNSTKKQGIPKGKKSAYGRSHDYESSLHPRPRWGKTRKDHARRRLQDD